MLRMYFGNVRKKQSKYESSYKSGKKKIQCPAVDTYPTTSNGGKINNEATVDGCQENNPLLAECLQCSHNNEHIPAFTWCTVCHETLCESCNMYHEEFKYTKHHTVIGVSQYIELEHLTKDVATHCKDHPDAEIKLVCVDHMELCCFLCKNTSHRGCNTKLFNQVMFDINHLLTRLKGLIRHLDEIDKNRISDSTSLDSSRIEFVQNLKQNRTAINCFLDEIDKDALSKFDETFEMEHEKFAHQRTEIAKMEHEMKKRLEIVTKLSEYFSSANLQIFLLMYIANIDYKRLKKQQDSFYDISVEGKISFELTEQGTGIVMKNNSKFVRSPCNIRLSEDLKETTLECVNDNENVINSASLINVKKCFSQNTNMDQNFEESLTSKDLNDFVESNTHLENEGSYSGSFNTFLAGSTPCGSEYRFRDDIERKYSFYVRKSENDINLVDVQVLPDGDIAILETSTPRLLIYDKRGSPRKGAVSLLYVPSCLAVYRKNKVAITISELKTIAIVSTHSFTIENYVSVQDRCHGICIIDNYFIVNCLNQGLKIMDNQGNISRVLSHLKGKLYLCSGIGRNVFWMKAHSRTIIGLNIKSEESSEFHVRGLQNSTGIAVDDENNLLVTCSGTNKVYRKKNEYVHAEPIITSKWLNDPSSISYDKNNKEIVVINNGRKSVSTFCLHDF